MPTQTFWIEILPKVKWIYECRADGPCPSNNNGDHIASSEPFVLKGDEKRDMNEAAPKTCACGYVFHWRDKTGHGQNFWRKRGETEERIGTYPPGSLYETDFITGYDGKSIVCVLPNGHHWYIDSRASNCTMRDDSVHRCWIRHGTVGETVTVDKNGHTCQAGGGSIQSGSYHGHLKNGILTDA